MGNAMKFFERHKSDEHFQELERWRVTCAKYEIWLSEFSEIATVLRNLRSEASGDALDASWPPMGKGPWTIDGLRQAIRRARWGGYQPIETGSKAVPPGPE